MPAHLEAEFVTGGLDFSQFEQLGKSWSQLDAMDKSWSQLEMMGLQQWKEKEEEGQDVQQYQDQLSGTQSVCREL